jgi:hypothetical protein
VGEFFLAADEDDAFGELPGALEAREIGESGLIALGELVGAGHRDELLRELERTRDPALGAADVVRLPRKLRDALSETEDFTALAGSWVHTDDLASDGWDPIDAVELLEELAQLARDAREAGIDLWYRWSASPEG